ncbi:SUKH-3 domain-containing protein [Streptomyces antibioticus]|uniref:SUKH-3 domain-containing protein n=1 Tax=Streptomyces antibioticus TaxID=1890 RepID=UPI0033BE6247
MTRFATEVERVLRLSGWSPGRQTDIGVWKEPLSGFTWHPAAERFLAEFGGVSVDVSGPGVDVAREPFVIDPELAVGEEEAFQELSERFGRRFFPVGETGQGEFFLALDEDGVLYLLAARVFRLGPVDQGLEKLITGVKPVKLSLPE